MMIMYRIEYVHTITPTDKSCSHVKKQHSAEEPKHMKSVNRITACPNIRESGKSSKNHKAQPCGVWQSFFLLPCPLASLKGRESLFRIRGVCRLPQAVDNWSLYISALHYSTFPYPLSFTHCAVLLGHVHTKTLISLLLLLFLLSPRLLISFYLSSILC